MNRRPAIEDLRGSLDAMLQAGAWLVAIIVMFVVTPPRLTPADDGLVFVRAAQFVVAVLLGLAVVAIRRGRFRLRIVWMAAVGCTLAAVGALFAYLWLLSDRTCSYDGRGPVVIGNSMLPSAARYASSLPRAGCEILIQDVAGDTASIWPRSELIANHLLLSATFMITVALFALSATLAVESLKRAELA